MDCNHNSQCTSIIRYSASVLGVKLPANSCYSIYIKSITNTLKPKRESGKKTNIFNCDQSKSKSIAFKKESCHWHRLKALNKKFKKKKKITVYHYRYSYCTPGIAVRKLFRIKLSYCHSHKTN